MPDLNEVANNSAFPFRIDESSKYQGTGMTLREWYAGLALHGLLSTPQKGTNRYSLDTIPIAALNAADALLEQLKRKQ